MCSKLILMIISLVGCIFANAEGFTLSRNIPYNRCITPGDIAISFSQGPTKATRVIASTLMRDKVPASFFVTTDYINDPMVSINLQLLANEMAGNTVGIFINSKVKVSEMSPQDLVKLVHKKTTILSDSINKKVKYVRFDSINLSSISPDQLEALRKAGYYVVGISIDTYDYDNPDILSVYKDYLDNTTGSKPSLIFGHTDAVNYDGSRITEVIKYATKKGYKFVNMEKCLGHPVEDNRGSNNGSSNDDSTKSSGRRKGGLDVLDFGINKKKVSSANIESSASSFNSITGLIMVAVAINLGLAL